MEGVTKKNGWVGAQLTLISMFFLVTAACNQDDALTSDGDPSPHGPDVNANQFISVVGLEGEDVDIHFVDEGQGTALVFIPGWTMTTQMFEKQVAHFSGQYRVIVFDPRGQGLSSKPKEGNYYVQHAHDLEQILNALGVEQFVLISWSWGVVEHLTYIKVYGDEAILASVFIDGSPKSLALEPGEWGDGNLAEDIFWPQWATKNRQELNQLFAEWMLEDQSQENIDWVIQESMKTPNYIATLLGYDAVFSDFTDEVIAHSGVKPVLYVLREDWSDTARSWIEANTPAAHIYVNGKHLMFWEHADEFNARLSLFLENVL